MKHTFHCHLQKSFRWYNNWHKHPHHKHTHWAIFTIVTLGIVSFISGQINSFNYTNELFSEEFIPTAQAQSFPGTSWPKSSPASQGMSSSALQAIPTSIIDDAIVIRNGYQVWSWGNITSNHGGWASTVRSMLTTAWGIAIKRGDIPGGIGVLEKSVASLPGDSHGVDGAVKHLLSYTACANPPGSRWQYSCKWFENYAIFKEVTGMTAYDYNNKYLYPALGGGSSFSEGSDTGDPRGETSRLDASVSQAARWGYFWLKKGNWNGKQIVDPEFVSRTIKPGPDGTGPNANEGWQIHLYRTSSAEFTVPGCPKDLFMAAGATDRAFIIVSPSLNLVVARWTSLHGNPPSKWMGQICQAVTGSSSTPTPSSSPGPSSSPTPTSTSTPTATPSPIVPSATPNPDPTVNSITPNSVYPGGTLEILGDYLTSNIQLVDLDGKSINISGWTDSSLQVLTVIIPSTIIPGIYSVNIAGSNGPIPTSLVVTVLGNEFNDLSAASAPVTTPVAPEFQNLITSAYSYSLIIVGIAVFMMIMWGGFLWLTSAANPGNIATAKRYIFNAIIGAILLLSSYVILYTINPELVGGDFELPGIVAPPPIQQPPSSGGSSQIASQNLIKTIGLGSFSTNASCGGNYHARQNVEDMAGGGKPAVCTSGTCTPCTAGGVLGNIYVWPAILDGLTGLWNNGARFTVTSFTTGNHSTNSLHYQGRAVDIVINSSSASAWLSALNYLRANNSGNIFCETTNGTRDANCNPVSSGGTTDHIHWDL